MRAASEQRAESAEPIRAAGRKRRRLLVAAIAAVALGTSASLASAATGDLTYLDCITGETQSGPGGSGACAQISSANSFGTDSGLGGLRGIAGSPDGKSLYAVSSRDDAVARFDRNPDTGTLTYRGCITGDTDSGPSGTGACAQIPKATVNGLGSGLDQVWSVAVSPDGRSLYAASPGDDAVARFDRNATTGALAYRGCITGETESGPSGSGACSQVTSAASLGNASGLDHLRSVAASADGKSLYTGSNADSAVARFDRDSTGALTYRGCITGSTQIGPGGSGACAQIPSASSFGGNSGLQFLQAITVSPDGKSLYAAAEGDTSVARFDRNTTSGALTYRGCITGETESSGVCLEIDSATSGGANSGLDGRSSITVSANGASLYVVSEDDDAVARFNRGSFGIPGLTTPGAITYGSCITGETQSGPAGTGACSQIPTAASGGVNSGLDGPMSVAPSADGNSLYVASFSDDAVAHFDRGATTGVLTYRGCITGEQESGTVTGTCAQVGSATLGGLHSGLNGPLSLAVTADGESVYAAGADTLTRFAREDPPQTQINSGPSGATNDPTPTFTFSSDEANVSFECQVDGAGFTACSGPGASHTTSSLPDGPHSFEVRARDTFGTADPSPASRSFEVDTVSDTSSEGAGDGGAGDGGSGGGPGGGIAADTSAPVVEVAARSTQKARRLVIRVRCVNEPCGVVVRGRAVAKRPRASSSKATTAAKRRKIFRLKPRRRSLDAGESKRLRVKFKKNRRSVRRVRRLVRRDWAARAKIRVVATDAAGNTSVKRLRVRLKR